MIFHVKWILFIVLLNKTFLLAWPSSLISFVDFRLDPITILKNYKKKQKLFY